ncbi:MAG: hypothetical protein M9898_05665 [Chitinophagaceae bacterium]|nr:hypothetical protein [Chitinophagaceae bacterium]
MKQIIFSVALIFLVSANAFSQNDPPKNLVQKTVDKVNKAKAVIAVFQPYFLKARQIFFDTKELVEEVKELSKSKSPQGQDASGSSTEMAIRNYLPRQQLYINDEATINEDGSGNWGNQNNGIYGNCLDVMTGAVMGLAEAEENPKRVDVIFIAANGSYQLWSPSYARNEVAAEYTSRSTQESVTKWSDVNETEIAETRITAGQFDKIQTNSQILSAVKNASNYASWVTLFGKLEGKVFAVRTELEDRTVYGLIKVMKHYGTEGSNGYLKIQIKAQGLRNNEDGELDTRIYLR